MKPMFLAMLSALVLGPLPPEPPGHGGGCRKSSPPGQCCHMESATGRVHCH
ncbi:hypothetical protein [Poseidonocella sp. HB161398]|uniref:hypothetical protein n=1 Tax=Poseidonocella sp. HB161398 TaxID=2320855 RepID=UPI001485F750|nr:hypothetical protein [Poseidonocella sp. HB161398]